MSLDTRIRPARPEDLPAIVGLVRELAAYEREPDAAVAVEEDFAAVLFGPQPTVFAHVAVVEGEVVGLAVWFLTFSTWTGRQGIWLEDLFVVPQHRGSGLGKALLRELARICVERGWTRLEWTVLDWNTPSIDFYRSIGAEPMDEWTTQRLAGEPLLALARG